MWDCFNVLIHYNTPAFFDFLRKHSRNFLPPERVFTGRGLELVKSYDLALISSGQFFNGMKELFQLEGVTQESFFSTLGSVIQPDREALAIRDYYLQRGVGTVLVTNMNDFNVGHILRNYPEFIREYDYKMISCEEGVAKPNPEAWIRPLDALGLRAEECIFIDDTLSNVNTACQLGIKGWYYNITDHNFCHNGKLEEERQKLKDFLSFLWNQNILKPR